MRAFKFDSYIATLKLLELGLDITPRRDYHLPRMKSQPLIQSTIILLLAKSLIWFALGIVYFAQRGGLQDFRVSTLAVSLLMFADALIYLFVAWGIRRRSKPIFLFALFFVTINAVLAITDQFGLLDLLVLLPDLVILALLLATRDAFTPKPRTDNA